MMQSDSDLHMTSLQNPHHEIELASEITRKTQSHVTEDVLHNTDHSSISNHQNGATKSVNSIQSVIRGSIISDIFQDSNLRFGWKCISSEWLQLFNKPVFFLVCACLAGVAEGLVMTGITFSVLTSIEKQFGYTSSEVAYFPTTYEITYGICGPFVGYMCHAHKPRYIGLGLLIMSVGSVILSIPKFIIGTYEAGIERTSDFCNVGNNTDHEVICNDTDVWYYQFIFILGYIILGIGAVPLQVLTPAHIDEVTNRGQSSLYMGIYYAFNAIGPAIGFIIAMPVLDKWVDLKQPPHSSLTPSDTNWVGAWWLGFLIGAGLLLLPVIPMVGFPKEFPATEDIRHMKLQHVDSIAEDKELKHDLKSVWPAIKVLLQKPPFLFVTLAITTESLAIGGYATFLPKFIHTQFHTTASDSALYTGIIVIPGAAGGIFAGGYVAKRFSWNCRQILRFATVMAFISSLLCAFALVGCEGRKVVGQDQSTGALHTFTDQCNRGCHCNTQLYKPICTVEDQKTYYSPCHGGCSKNDSINKEFYNCTCFSENVNHAVDGTCTKECTLFPLFAVGAVFLMFFTFLNNVPLIMASLRIVNEGQGSFAIGFQQIFVRFLGFIPAPIVFGALIDKSCRLWGSDECSEESTNCLEYNQAYFRYYMFALGVAPKCASFVFILLAYKLYRLPENRSPPSLPQPAVICSDSVIENYNVSMNL